MKRWAAGGAILALALSGSTGCTSATAAPNLSGTWRLDPARSSAPRFGGPGGERRAGGEGRGRWGGTGAEGERGGEGRRGPRMRIPDRIRIEQSPSGLRLSDSLGAVVGVIRTGTTKDDGAAGVARMDGKWHGERLEVTQASPRGGQMTQVWELGEGGTTLSVKTTMQRPGGMPAREFVRVYRREGA